MAKQDDFETVAVVDGIEVQARRERPKARRRSQPVTVVEATAEVVS